MRKAKLTTSEWHLPSRLRIERLRQLMARQSLKPILNSEFISGLEARRRDARQLLWRLFLIQAPVFLFLAFSLVHLDVNATFLGVSTAASSKLREVLLLISATFALFSSILNRDVSAIDEMLKAAAKHAAGNETHLREFLEVRYGVSYIGSWETFTDELQPGGFQFVTAFLWIFLIVVFVVMLALMTLTVQALSLWEVYLRPNVPQAMAWFVIAYVILGDAVIFVGWATQKAYQPFQTYADLKALNRLEYTDKQKYDEIIQEMVSDWAKQGPLMRLFTRPKLKQLRK